MLTKSKPPIWQSAASGRREVLTENTSRSTPNAISFQPRLRLTASVGVIDKWGHRHSTMVFKNCRSPAKPKGEPSFIAMA